MEQKSVNIGGILGPSSEIGPTGVTTFPRGILKAHGGSKTRKAAASQRRPIVYSNEKEGTNITIHPTKNPSVPIRRFRKHKHGTRKLRVVTMSRKAMRQREEAIAKDAEGLDRGALIDKLSHAGRVKDNTKMPTDMLRDMYKVAKESGLLE